MALTTLTRLKALLGVTSDSQNVRLQLLLDAAEAAVKQYCNRDFESQTYTEYLSGNNTPRLALRQTPVTALTSVHLDSSGYFGTTGGAFDSATLLEEGVDYVLDRDDQGGARSRSGILLRIGSVWPMLQRVATVSRLAVDAGPAWGNVKAVYTAGYASGQAPADLQYAVCLLAAHMQRTFTLGGGYVEYEKVGDYAYRLADVMKTQSELGGVRSLLASYKEMGW